MVSVATDTSACALTDHRLAQLLVIRREAHDFAMPVEDDIGPAAIAVKPKAAALPKIRR
jgi:hypothetical protein